jgi:hypothetical protein
MLQSVRCYNFKKCAVGIYCLIFRSKHRSRILSYIYKFLPDYTVPHARQHYSSITVVRASVVPGSGHKLRRFSAKLPINVVLHWFRYVYTFLNIPIFFALLSVLMPTLKLTEIETWRNIISFILMLKVFKSMGKVVVCSFPEYIPTPILSWTSFQYFQWYIINNICY